MGVSSVLADSNIPIKQECDSELSPFADVLIKKERESSPLLAIGKQPHSVNTRVHMEDGHEVTEIFDSDEEPDYSPLSQGVTANEEMIPMFSGWQDDDDTTVFNDTDDNYFRSDQDSDSDSKSDISIESLHVVNSSDYEAIGDAEISNTVWLDVDVTSTVEYDKTQITRQCVVDAVEYVSGLPSYWPIPQDRRAYMLDLSNPTFKVKDKTGKLKTVDFLIKNQVSGTLPWLTAFILTTLISQTGSGFLDWQLRRG